MSERASTEVLQENMERLDLGKLYALHICDRISEPEHAQIPTTLQNPSLVTHRIIRLHFTKESQCSEITCQDFNLGPRLFEQQAKPKGCEAALLIVSLVPKNFKVKPPTLPLGKVCKDANNFIRS